MIKKIILGTFLALVVLVFSVSIRLPGDNKEAKYGVSFSVFHSDELKLDWKETYLAILDDLGVRRLRLSAHWPMIEPEKDKYNFSELDFQIREAEKRNASVILAVGRRLPGWPECHTPEWVDRLPLDQQRQELDKMLTVVVNRYKDSKAVSLWQVENEPFLSFFSRSLCMKYSDGSEDSLVQKIELVRKLDPSRQILITDSGEISTWRKAYRSGDVFGTSMYLYVWNRTLGPIRYPIIPLFFRIKYGLTRLILGEKPAIVIELSAEPWLLHPIVETSLDVQLDRMGLDKFNEIINFSNKTGFDTFYLWGAEWWYWLKIHDNDTLWLRAKEVFENK